MQAKPRVLMIGKFFPPVRGGMEEYVHALAEAVADSTDLTVLVHNQARVTERATTGRYRIIRAATWATFASQPLSPRIFLELVRARYDLIHLHVPNVQGLIGVLLFGGRAKVVVTHHADMVGFGRAGDIARWFYRRLLARTAVVTVLSLANRDRARDTEGIDVAFAALPLGLDPQRFAATPAISARAAEIRASALASAAAGSRATLFAFVGRLVPYKGLDVLIEALALAPDARVIVVGDGRERAPLEQQARARGVSARIRFAGEVDEAEKLATLHAADAFVLPSTTTAEAFGIVQVEAQLVGLPIVATDLPTGVTDVTRHGETGLVVPPGNAAALAAALQQLAADPDLRRRLGAGGLARAQAHYTLDAMRCAAGEIYAAALTPRPPSPPAASTARSG